MGLSVPLRGQRFLVRRVWVLSVAAREDPLSSSAIPSGVVHLVQLRELGRQPLHGELEFLRRVVGGLLAGLCCVLPSGAVWREGTHGERHLARERSLSGLFHTERDPAVTEEH